MKDYRKTSAKVVITYYSRRVHLNQIIYLNTYCLSSGVGGLRWQKMAAAHKTTCRLFPQFGWSRSVSPNQGEPGGATGLGVNLFVMYRRVAHKPCALDLFYMCGACLLKNMRTQVTPTMLHYAARAACAGCCACVGIIYNIVAH